MIKKTKKINDLFLRLKEIHDIILENVKKLDTKNLCDFVRTTHHLDLIDDDIHIMFVIFLIDYKNRLHDLKENLTIQYFTDFEKSMLFDISHFKNELFDIEKFYLKNAIVDCDDEIVQYYNIDTHYFNMLAHMHMNVQQMRDAVYTPIEIVKFQNESTLSLLKMHHDREAYENVNFIDPCCGSGVYLCHLLEVFYRRYTRMQFDYLYDLKMTQNDIDAVSHFLANMNIEIKYKQLTNDYRAFRHTYNTDMLELENEHRSIWNRRAVDYEMSDEKWCEKYEKQCRI